jgi:type II secretory pathway predicted ATPase ExeA
MYHEHFGFNRQPFSNTPDPFAFFKGAQRGAVLEALTYAVARGDAIIKVVGEVGTGKTMLCRMLESRMPDGTEIAYLANPSLRPEDILHAIAVEFGLGVPAHTPKLTVLHQLQAHFLQLHSAGRRAVLLVEEAQCMPLDTLEEIRLLSNLETSERKLLQIVLFGQPELDLKLAQPTMRQLTDRIANSFYLTPFNAEDVRDYVSFRLQRAGQDSVGQLFSPRALRVLHRASRGLVRRINLLADKALLAAFADQAQRVLVRHVRRATRDGALARAWDRRVPLGVSALAAAMLLGFVVQPFTPPQLSDQEPGERNEPVVRQSSPAALQEMQAVLDEAARAVHQSAPADEANALDQENATDTLLQQRLEATDAWVKQVPAGQYTIQIMSSRPDRPAELRGLARLVSGEELRGASVSLYIHRGQLAGQQLWVLSFGSFVTFSEAKSAMAQLPPSLAKFKPLIRTVGSLRTELGK